MYNMKQEVTVVLKTEPNVTKVCYTQNLQWNFIMLSCVALCLFVCQKSMKKIIVEQLNSVMNCIKMRRISV